jgi:hypothetical protein
MKGSSGKRPSQFPNSPIPHFRKEDEELRQFRAFWGDSLDFNLAQYSWLNDSTVSIKLFDSQTNEQAVFDVFGRGPSTVIISNRIRR